MVDTVVDKYARSPINNNIPCARIAIYFDSMYIANTYQDHLRRLCFQKDLNEYLKQKHDWSARTSADIDWEYHVKIIN